MGDEQASNYGHSIRIPSKVLRPKTLPGHMKKGRFLALWLGGLNG